MLIRASRQKFFVELLYFTNSLITNVVDTFGYKGRVLASHSRDDFKVLPEIRSLKTECKVTLDNWLLKNWYAGSDSDKSADKDVVDKIKTPLFYLSPTKAILCLDYISIIIIV